MKSKKTKKAQPAQHQDVQPGIESEMRPLPVFEKEEKNAERKLLNKVAIITGGDSGIGRAVAIAFAREGADCVISFLDETGDAKYTQNQVEKYGRKCILVSGDVSRERNCIRIVDKALKKFGRIDIVVNNAAVQYPQKKLEDISHEQLLKTFSTNIFPHFYLTKAALPHLAGGSSIISTTSVTAYRGSDHLIDYASTKGAIVGFIRSLSTSLAERGIRVNGVAPGPIWTPLIPSSFDSKHVAEFGTNVPMKRVGQPEEVAPCYVFLASDDSSYMTGQIMHPNGGEIING